MDTSDATNSERISSQDGRIERFTIQVPIQEHSSPNHTVCSLTESFKLTKFNCIGVKPSEHQAGSMQHVNNHDLIEDPGIQLRRHIAESIAKSHPEVLEIEKQRNMQRFQHQIEEETIKYQEVEAAKFQRLREEEDLEHQLKVTQLRNELIKLQRSMASMSMTNQGKDAMPPVQPIGNAFEHQALNLAGETADHESEIKIDREKMQIRMHLAECMGKSHPEVLAERKKHEMQKYCNQIEVENIEHQIRLLKLQKLYEAQESEHQKKITELRNELIKLQSIDQCQRIDECKTD